MGLSGWGWEDVIDTFKTAETDLDFLDSPIHGNSGPLTVRRWHREEMGRAQITFFDGMIETGESPISDINDRSQLPGLGVFPVTIDNNGNRVSTSLAYLTEEVRNRENLEIVTHAEVTRVVFNGTNAEGVSLANGEELTAERLAEAGVELVITARREERLNNAAREISDKYGVSVTPVVADSSTEEGREALYAACPDPDILAITIKPPAPNGDFLKVTPDMWRDSVETTLIGPIEIMRHYIPHMKDAGWGRIVNITTFSAKNPMIWRLMSGPARSALINYTASVSREIARYGVNINNLLPGMFATEGASEIMKDYAEAFGLEPDPEVVRPLFLANNHIPAGFIGDADDLAPMAAFLCSPLARFIVGQNIVIDGGQHASLF